MRRRFPHPSKKVLFACFGAVVVFGLGMSASFGLASSRGHDLSLSYTYPTNPPPPPPPPPPPG